MRATTFLGLVLSIGACGRIGYDPLVAVDPAVDAAPEVAPPDGPGPVDAPPFETEPPVDLGPEAPADVSPIDQSPDQLSIDMAPADRPPEVASPDLAPDMMMPPVCNQPFSAPAVVNISGVNGDIYAPRLGPTGLTLYFGEQESANVNSVDIYYATRTVVGGPFSAQQPLNEANSSSEDNGAFESADRLELFFFSRRPGGEGGRDLWVLRRATPGAGWGGPSPVAELNSASDDYMPSLTADGLTIYFASNRMSGTDNIWVARRPSRTAPFGTPTTVPELTSIGISATSPFTQSDGLALYFADSAPGGQGGLDLWRSTRPSPNGLLTAPVNLGPMFNSSAIDDDPSLSLDGRELFFVSDRVAQTSRIYRSIRCP